MAALLLAAALVWSPYTQMLVAPEVLEQQGVAEYGPALWALVRPVVTGAAGPSAPTNLSVE